MKLLAELSKYAITATIINERNHVRHKMATGNGLKGLATLYYY